MWNCNMIEQHLSAVSQIPHPVLTLRAFIHEREEVEVCRVRLGLTGFNQPTDVAVDPCSGAALDHISLVSVGAVPHFLWSRSHGPPLVENKMKRNLHSLHNAELKQQ